MWGREAVPLVIYVGVCKAYQKAPPLAGTAFGYSLYCTKNAALRRHSPSRVGQLAPALVNRTFFVFVAIFGVAGVFHLRAVAVHALAAQLANVVAGQPTGAFVVKVVTSCHLFILLMDYILKL